jgi:signal transduction histidine kinase
MELKLRSKLIYGLLFAVWALVVIWQIAEHKRVEERGKAYLVRNSDEIASTLGAFIRGLQFRGSILRTRLEPVLNELVSGYTNEQGRAAEILSIYLINATNQPIVSAGRPIDLNQSDILQQGERWGQRTLTKVYSIKGVRLASDGTNFPGPVILEERTNNMRGFQRRDRPPFDNLNSTNDVNVDSNAALRAEHDVPPPPQDRGPGGPDLGPGERRGPPPGEGEPRPRRPFWARGLNDAEYLTEIQRRELHGLVLMVSTETFQAMVRHDVWMRLVVCFFAGISALGIGGAWLNLTKTSDLQIRLVRASELNTHLREMNLAAAGLAHETRNPLNIIRGMAQMLSKQPDSSPEVREKARAMVNETDKVTAQLNEFINYSRPREVRRSALALNAAVNEVVRALSYDLEEKKIRLTVKGEPITIEADEQLFRQALFNLVLNATQAVGEGGQIQIVTQRSGSSASLEVRDDGPGVPMDKREEIFKPYFTTHQKGTGLGLAVVQQIVLAHGWEIRCLDNEPKGALFRVTHLKVV